MSRTEEETLVQKWQERVNLTDPLVISLDGKAPRLSNDRFEFDLNADGTMENISFVNSGSGFLAFDKNDNLVNDGAELFGPGTGNGFEAPANPFKDLLDRIKKLKQEMERLYKNMNPMSNQRRFRRSGQPYYQGLNPDTSILFRGHGGLGHPQSRWG